MCDCHEAHQCVRPAAIFGADAAEAARTGGLDDELVYAAGNHVFLARKVGHPEAVDHILARQLYDHRLAHRQVQFICIASSDIAFRVEIFDVEPPHVAGHAHAHGVLRYRFGERCGERQAPHQQSGQNHAGKSDAADPYRLLAAQRSLPAVWPLDGDVQRADHDRGYHHSHADKRPSQHHNAVGVRPGGVEHRWWPPPPSVENIRGGVIHHR